MAWTQPESLELPQRMIGHQALDPALEPPDHAGQAGEPGKPIPGELRLDT